MRIVIKVGTSTLAHPTGRLNIQRIELLCKVMSDLKNAGRYLAKSGMRAEAIYARAIFAALNNDYDTAKKLFTEAQRGGIAQAAGALKQLEEIKK